jgi:hypothetical protein
VDGGGVPLAGPVGLTARLYDAASGGTLIFKQSFTGVALADGHYTLNLGPTGEATDSPSDPLTTSLRTGLTGDLAAGAGRFVEITVDSDPPLARVALVLVPYAMRADHATTADVATNALDAQALGGVEPVVLEAMFGSWNFDGGPPSSDPSEGTADTDGDSQVNFVDSDNDNDGLSDSAEVGLGSNLNLITPSVSTVTPSGGEATGVTPVTVTGNGFLPGMTAQLGSQALTPSNLTGTSFDAQVGPQAPAAANLTLVNTNAESYVATAAFSFFLTTPAITSVSPSSGPGAGVTQVTVAGSGFLPGLTAQFGTQGVAVSNVTPTSFQAGVGPDGGPFPKVVNLLVTNPNGASGTRTSAFTFTLTPPVPLYQNYALIAPTQLVARGEQLLASGLVSSGNNRGRYAADTIVDGTVAFNVGSAVLGVNPSPVSWNSSRVIYNLRGWVTTDQVQLLRDNNGDNVVSSTEAVAIESPGVDSSLQSPSLVFDASDRPGGGYLRNVGGVLTAVAFHDRDGSGSFGGANEVVTIEPVTGATASLGEAAFDPSGRLAYVYYDSGAGRLRAAWDRSGDGDFADTVGGTPELVTVVTTSTPSCFGATFDTAGRLAVLYSGGLRRDLSGDGDFDDAGEAPAVGAYGHCDVTAASAGNRLVIAYLSGSTLKLRCDLNDDGDFLDTDEDVTVGASITGPLSVTESASGAVRVLTQNGVVLGPVR